MPYVLLNPYHNFVKEIPVDEVATPSNIYIFICTYFGTIIYMVMPFFGISRMTELEMITTVLYGFTSLMSLIALPMPFLVIGSSTAYLVNQSKKAMDKKQINLVAATLESYNTLTKMCGPALLIIFTVNVIALIVLSYISAISLKGCQTTSPDLGDFYIYYIIVNMVILVSTTLTLIYFAHSVDECYQNVKSLKSISRYELSHNKNCCLGLFLTQKIGCLK